MASALFIPGLSNKPEQVSTEERAFMARLSAKLAIGTEDLDPAMLTDQERDALRYERIPR